MAEHGKHSLKIALSPETMPVFYFDYYDPVRQPVRRVLVANQGWFHVRPGEPLTLSAFLRADAEGVAAQLAAIEAPNRMQRKQVTVGQKWQRYEFTFRPAEAFIFVAAGLDLEASGRDAATLWLDAIQLERGEQATAYEPRQPVESFLATSELGNIVTDAHGRHRDGCPRLQQHRTPRRRSTANSRSRISSIARPSTASRRSPCRRTPAAA